LVPAADIDQMHFAIDQMPIPVVASTPAPPAPGRIPSTMLTDGLPVVVAGERDTVGRVEITIRDLYRNEGRLFVRYVLHNRTSASYAPVRPASWLLDGAKSQQSLVTAGQHQLGERLSRTVKAKTETALVVLDGDQVSIVTPGAVGSGWLALKDDFSSGHEGNCLVRIQFAADAKGALDALLVLPPVSLSEVAHARPADQ
jgi:hypothetical protein